MNYYKNEIFPDQPKRKMISVEKRYMGMTKNDALDLAICITSVLFIGWLGWLYFE
jgi:hypothetical protein